MNGKHISSDTKTAFAELADLCESRAATYRLLSRLYLKEVDKRLLSELKEMSFPASSGDDKLDKGYRLIARYLSNTWENSQRDLAIDYVRVFLGNGIDAKSAAYPLESVYTSEKRLRMQNARDEVLAIYKSIGIDRNPSWKEGEDHIACELEFEGLLAQRTTEALRVCDEEEAVALFKTQLNFMDDHILSWVPMFTMDIKKFARTDLYLGLAWATEGFLSVDHEFLVSVLDEGKEVINE